MRPRNCAGYLVQACSILRSTQMTSSFNTAAPESLRTPSTSLISSIVRPRNDWDGAIRQGTLELIPCGRFKVLREFQSRLSNHAEVHKRPRSVAEDKAMLETIILPRLGRMRISTHYPSRRVPAACHGSM